MFGSTRHHLVALVTTGAITVGAVLLLTLSARSRYTPVVEAVGFLAAIAFLWLGYRWTFSVLSDVYGD